MTPLVGKEINVIEKSPAPGAQLDTTTLFVPGVCGRADHTGPTHVYSMADVELLVGARADGQTLYDGLDGFFGEGGRHAVVGRVIGDTPVSATIPLFDAAGTTGTDDALHVTARTAGEWGNALNAEVIAGDQAGEFRIVITHDTDDRVTVTSPSLASRDEAVAWGETAPWITVALGDSDEDPRVQGPTSLASGDDDDGTIDDDSWAAAFATLPAELGPGRVAAFGRTTITGQTQLLEHARDTNRRARLDVANTGTLGTVTAACLAVRALTGNLARYGSVFTDWKKIPGIAGGTKRTVPMSAIQCGMEARYGAVLTANDPVAGENGVCQYAIEIANERSADDRDAIYSAGGNPSAIIAGTIRTYGYRTAVSPVTDANWLAESNGCLIMEIKARLDSVLETFVLKKIDPKRVIFKTLYSRLQAVLDDYPSDLATYTIDTESVNTALTIADREINAAVDLAPVGFSEKVRLNLSKTLSTEV